MVTITGPLPWGRVHMLWLQSGVTLVLHVLHWGTWKAAHHVLLWHHRMHALELALTLTHLKVKAKPISAICSHEHAQGWRDSVPALLLCARHKECSAQQLAKLAQVVQLQDSTLIGIAWLVIVCMPLQRDLPSNASRHFSTAVLSLVLCRQLAGGWCHSAVRAASLHSTEPGYTCCTSIGRH